MVLARGSYPPLPYPMLALRSQQPAIAEIAARLGGNLTTHIGHIVGGDVVVGTPNPAPLNPSGDRGHDHSGGYYGRALHRTVAALDFGGASYDPAGFDAAPSAYRSGHAAVGASTTTVALVSQPIHVWCPPCDPTPGVGAYAQLAVTARFDCESTALISGDAAFLRVVQATNGAPSAVVDVPFDTQPTSTGFYNAFSTSTSKLPMAVGRMNTLVLSTVVTRTGSGSARGVTLRLDSLDLGVYDAD